MAYGPLALKPREFERLQPHEFYKLYDGYIWRQGQQESMTAYFVCQLLNVSGKALKRPITVKELLEPLKPKKKQDRKADEKYLRKKFGLDNQGGDSVGDNRATAN